MRNSRPPLRSWTNKNGLLVMERRTKAIATEIFAGLNAEGRPRFKPSTSIVPVIQLY